MQNPITVTVKKVIGLDRIADLLCTAWEGGSDYWCRCVDEKQPDEWTFFTKSGDGKDDPNKYTFLIPLNGGTVTIHDLEDDKKYILDSIGIERGLLVFAEKFTDAFAEFLKGEDDAGTGDMFLQCCIFGDVIYG